MPSLKLSFKESSSNHCPLISLNGSKSISNRVLLIQALSKKETEIDNLSKASDTAIMSRLLKNSNELILDAGDAGTAFRFMTAYLALKPGKHFLTGSTRMLQRPIAVLVDALISLGAKISYSAKIGYPPLSISSGNFDDYTNEISVDASVSSQYISALLMIGPCLPNGLKINIRNGVVSEPYIDMTISLMEHFGQIVHKDKYSISVESGKYNPISYAIESDWSAASYYYSIAAISSNSINIRLKTLYQGSIQGDSRIAEIMNEFGISTEFEANGTVLISNRNRKIPSNFEYDFTNCPDLAQTITVICAALNIPSTLKGLKTLKINETDSIAALKIELEDLGAEIDADDEIIIIKKGIDKHANPKQIKTYKDHRMAMSFAALALIYGTVKFDDADVVAKSYPDFWDDLSKLGFNTK
jgi:3-phosphoshikimate 1-carboxyvinyltransferase